MVVVANWDRINLVFYQLCHCLPSWRCAWTIPHPWLHYNQVASEIYRIFYGNLWNFAGAFVCTQGSCIQNFRFLASVQHLCCQKTWFQCKISQNKPFSSKKCSNSFSNGPEGLKFCVLGYLYTSQSHAKFQPSRSTRKKIIGKKPLLETHKISVFC